MSSDLAYFLKMSPRPWCTEWILVPLIPHLSARTRVWAWRSGRSIEVVQCFNVFFCDAGFTRHRRWGQAAGPNIQFVLQNCQTGHWGITGSSGCDQSVDWISLPTTPTPILDLPEPSPGSCHEAKSCEAQPRSHACVGAQLASPLIGPASAHVTAPCSVKTPRLTGAPSTSQTPPSLRSFETEGSSPVATGD